MRRKVWGFESLPGHHCNIAELAPSARAHTLWQRISCPPSRAFFCRVSAGRTGRGAGAASFRQRRWPRGRQVPPTFPQAMQQDHSEQAARVVKTRPHIIAMHARQRFCLRRMEFAVDIPEIALVPRLTVRRRGQPRHDAEIIAPRLVRLRNDLRRVSATIGLRDGTLSNDSHVACRFRTREVQLPVAIPAVAAVGRRSPPHTEQV